MAQKQSEGRFGGKVVVITGAGAGIGREMTLAFAREGARLAIGARRLGLLEETADLAKSETGHRPLVIETDVTEEAQVDRLVDSAASDFGGLDIVISNAASAGKDLFLWEHTLENWNQTLATHLTAQFLMSRAALRHLMPRRSGVIILFSSTAAYEAFPRKSHYSASKFGALALTRTLAKEAGAHGIRANCVVPGGTSTELLGAYIERIAGERGIEPEEMEAELAANTSLGRLVTPGEVSDTVLFLCSDAGSGITGQSIRVCAGGSMT